MADSVRELDIIINAKDQASKVIRGMGGTFSELQRTAVAGSAAITAALGFATKSAIDTAINFEQAKVAFTTFLGDGEKAGKLIKQLSDFAAKTPFDLPQVVEGGKRLLAMGISADQIIPTFKKLGDISGGNTDKLNSLILAYGQVNAATRLTGAELRQFTEAGVPLLDMLGQKMGKTSGEIQDMISKNKISFQDVSDVLTTATSSGGRFFNAMESQSKTLGGIISNTRDEIVRFALSIMGLTTTGDVKEGSIFFYLKEAAQGFLQKLQDVRPIVQNFVEQLIADKDKLLIVGAAIAGLFAPLIIAAAPAIAAAIAFSVAFAGVVATFVLLKDQLGGATQAIIVMLAGVGVLAGAWAGLNIVFGASPIGAVIVAAVGLATALGVLITQTDAFKTKQDLITEANNRVLDSENKLKAARDDLIASDDALKDANFRLEGAALAVERAEKNKIEMIKLFGPASLEAQQASHDLEGAHRTLEKAKKDVTTATNDNIKKEQEYVTQKDESIKASDDRQKSLTAEKGTWEKLGDSIQNAINKIGEYAKLAITGVAVPSNVKNGRRHGGYVPGDANDAVPMLLHGGERVIPKNGVDVNPGQGGGGAVNINITGSFNLDSDDRVNQLAQTIISMLNRQNELANKGLAV